MSRLPVLYLIFILITFLVMVWGAVYSRRHREIPGAYAFMWICIFTSLLALFEGLSMAGPNKAWALRWFDLRFITLAFAPVLWLVFVLRYTGALKWFGKPWIAILFGIPLLTQVMIWTNGYHGLWVSKPVDFHETGMFFIVQTSARLPGPWTWVHLIYSYVLMMGGIMVLLVTSVRLYRQYRKGVVAVVAGMLTMTLGAVYPFLNPMSWSQFNPLTLGFAAGSVMVAWGIYRFDFLRAVPVFEMIRRFPVVLVILFIALTTCILAAGSAYYRHYENNFRMQIERQLASILELKISEITHWRRERMSDAAVIYQNAAFASLLQSMLDHPADGLARKQMSVWIQKVRSSYEYKNIVILDENGIVRLSALPLAEPLCGEIERRRVGVLKSGQITFLDFHRDGPGRPIHLSLMVPIIDNRRPLGLMVMLIDPNAYLYPLIQRWPTASETAETLLVRREGADVLFLNELRFQKNTALSLRIPLSQQSLPAARAVKGLTGIREGIDYRGVGVMAATDRVPDSPWFMIARIDLAEVYEPIRSYLWLMIFLVGSFIVGTGCGVWILWQRQNRDIYRKEVEASEILRESEEKFRKAFMTSPDVITLTRYRDGLLVSVNPGFKNVTGYSDEEVIGKKVPDLALWVDDSERQRLRQKIQADGMLVNEEVRFRRKNGEIFYGLLSASLINLDGETHQLTITRDINERKLAQDAIVQSEQKYRTLHESMIDGFVSVTMDGKILDSNAVYQNMLGYTPDELATLTYIDITPENWRTFEKDIVENQILTRGHSDIYEKEYRRKDGTVFPVELHTVLLRDEQGKPSGMWAIVRDITERKKAEKEILELNESLEARVMERTVELLAKNQELESLNRVFVDRELRMRELKARIAEFEKYYQKGNIN